MGHYHDVLAEIREPYQEVQEAVPGVASGYAEMHKAAMGEGELPAKMKELIALAIAITRECDGCIAAHARGAARRGATAAEVAEMVGVAIMMNGGPGTVWGPRALAAFHEFAEAPEADRPAAWPSLPPRHNGVVGRGRRRRGTDGRTERAGEATPPIDDAERAKRLATSRG